MSINRRDVLKGGVLGLLGAVVARVVGREASSAPVEEIVAPGAAEHPRQPVCACLETNCPICSPLRKDFTVIPDSEINPNSPGVQALQREYEDDGIEWYRPVWWGTADDWEPHGDPLFVSDYFRHKRTGIVRSREWMLNHGISNNLRPLPTEKCGPVRHDWDSVPCLCGTTDKCSSVTEYNTAREAHYCSCVGVFDMSTRRWVCSPGCEGI